MENLCQGQTIVPNKKKTEKRGRKEGYRKPTTMTGKIAMRVPQELEDWLAGIAGPKGLTVGDIARMYLLEKMQDEQKEVLSTTPD